MDAAYWSDLDRHTGGRHMEEIWLAHPEVRAAVNVLISGDPHRWPLDWFQERFAARLPLSNALTIGCGTGSLERDLIHREICLRITGVDVVGPPLEKARQEAAVAGMTERINYVQMDAAEFLAKREGQLDAVFFHAALHHFNSPDDILQKVVRALRPGGLVYVDEYVGPSRHQWNPLRLLLPNLAYYALPRSVRRVRLIRAPINREDPTEAVASHQIVPALGRWLNVLERKAYGGNLLSLIYPNLRRPDAASDPQAARDFKKAIGRLLTWESSLLAMMGSYFSIVVAEKPSRPSRAPGSRPAR